jgi:ribosomal protein L14E/L6E/L27E
MTVPDGVVHQGCVLEYSLTRLRLQVRKSIRAWTPRQSLQPGTVLILLAGRFRGKRVVLLKNLDQGVLLVTGPFKINGVPLRRVNSRYVIATSYKVELKGLDANKITEIASEKYFTRDKASDKAGEEAFFKQGEKPQVRSQIPRNRKKRETDTYHYRRRRSAAAARLTRRPSTRL